jgi:hypothetical protein
MKIHSARFAGETLFPRHIILYAVFGMFVAIVLGELFKVREVE